MYRASGYMILELNALELKGDHIFSSVLRAIILLVHYIRSALKVWGCHSHSQRGC